MIELFFISFFINNTLIKFIDSLIQTLGKILLAIFIVIVICYAMYWLVKCMMEVISLCYHHLIEE